MIKYALTLAIALQSIVSFGQEFYGIKPIGNKDYTVNQFKAKGFKFLSAKDNTVILEKSINGEMVELYITFTNKTKQVVSFSVFTSDRSNWYTLKSIFDRHVNNFKDKYGAPTKEVSKFLYPFDEDINGMEMTAVASDKADFYSAWIFSDYSLSVSIIKSQRIIITYLNKANFEIYDKEEQEIY